jgi:hypothetical protein
VIVAAVCAEPDQRAAIEAVAEELGVPFCGVWLETPEEVMMSRVTFPSPSLSRSLPHPGKKYFPITKQYKTLHRALTIIHNLNK